MLVQVMVHRGLALLEDLALVDESELDNFIMSRVRQYGRAFSLSFSFEPTEEAMQQTRIEVAHKIKFMFDLMELNHNGKLLKQSLCMFMPDGRFMLGLKSEWSVCPWKVFRMMIL